METSGIYEISHIYIYIYILLNCVQIQAENLKKYMGGWIAELVMWSYMIQIKVFINYWPLVGIWKPIILQV
jgi:hypothetical protein